MRGRWIRWTLAAAVALVALSGAGAAEAAEGTCREECVEAKVVCHAAAHRAHRVCREACAENDEGCQAECRRAFTAAKIVCTQQRLECREACDPVAACGCVADCGERLSQCRELLGECRDECRAATRDHLRRCRALAENGAPPPLVRACVERAENEGEQCMQGCQWALRCGTRFTNCVERCQP